MISIIYSSFAFEMYETKEKDDEASERRRSEARYVYMRHYAKQR